MVEFCPDMMIDGPAVIATYRHESECYSRDGL